MMKFAMAHPYITTFLALPLAVMVAVYPIQILGAQVNK